MSDSDASSNEEIEEKASEQKPDVPLDKKNLPRHLRIRYWHSWEEMLLVELWRKHFDEVTCLDKNLPVFRTISIGMKDSGFHVTSQEVRRKIKTIKNKYITERRRLNESEDKDAKSDWRLYPLVHCLMTPTLKSFDPNHENMALNTILDRLKIDPLFNILLSGMPVVSTLEKIEAGEVIQIPPPKPLEDSFPVENKTVADCIAHAYENKHKRSYTPRYQRPSEVAAARAKELAAEARASNITAETQVQNSVLPLANHPSSSKPILISKRTNLLKRFATVDSIKQLRSENIKLVEECVIATKRLKMEEQQLKAYEKIVQQIQMQYEYLFKNLKIA